MILAVDIRVLDSHTGNDTQEGTIRWDGYIYRLEPETPLMQSILRDPIWAIDHELTAKDGDQFMESLFLHYKSANLRASKASVEYD